MSTKKVEWTARLAAWAASGLTAEEFAAKNGLTSQALKWWRWHLGAEAARAKSAPAAKAMTTTAFAEVVVAASPPTPPSGAFEVLLRSGQVVRVPAVFDAVALRRLIDALEEVA